MSVTAYFTPDWAPTGVRYFRCERLQATLTPDACSINWRRASEGAALRCRGCPVGPEHSGEAQANTSPLRGQMVCARCQRGATRLVTGWLCVSCWNREREFKLGKNARGSYPSRMQPLDPRSIAYTEAGEPATFKRPHTTGREELMVGLLRDSAGALAFHFNGRANLPAVRQGNLW
ncbi:MAG: hypothetical protein AB9M53_00690 [Leptothrix sp. (in: b-proteobacteria)]